MAPIALALALLVQGANPEQMFQDAVAAQQRGDDAKAIRLYQELVKLHPESVEVRANLGAVLARQSRFDEAIEQYRAALERDQANPALRFNLALAYYKKGALAEAAKELTVVQSADPGNVRVATLLGDCHLRLGRPAQAVALLMPLEPNHPDDLALAWTLGAALIQSGRKAEGLERVEKVARRGNSAEAYLLAGQTALKLTYFERARDLAAAAVRLNPKLPGALTLQGSALQDVGDSPGAIAALKKAIEVDPNDFEAHLNLGAILLKERDLEGARRYLERARQLNPGSNLARYEMARLKRTEGNLEAAVKDFEKVVQDDPDWPQPHIELSALYFRLNRQEDGEKERAIFDRLNSQKR